MNPRPVQARDLVAYLEHEVTPSEAESIEAHLAGSAEARRQLGQLRELERRLSAPVVELEGFDLVSAVRRKAQRLESVRETRWRAPFWAALTSVASVALVIGLGWLRGPVSEFRSKASASVVAPTTWAGVQVYRVSGNQPPERVEDALTRGDGLLFSYTNLGQMPYEYLMIVAVAADHQAYWFHPAADGETNSSSVMVQGPAAQVPLPELILHDLPSGPLTLYAVFTHAPLSAQDVERWLDTHPGGELPAPSGDAALQIFHFRVEP